LIRGDAPTFLGVRPLKTYIQIGSEQGTSRLSEPFYAQAGPIVAVMAERGSRWLSMLRDRVGTQCHQQALCIGVLSGHIGGCLMGNPCSCHISEKCMNGLRTV
jgi:hypothetical protein